MWVNYGSIESLNLYLNDVPRGKTVECFLSPIKAIPLVKTKIRDPSVTVDGKKVVFPVELESGDYIEFDSPSGATAAASDSKLIQGSLSCCRTLSSLIKK